MNGFNESGNIRHLQKILYPQIFHFRLETIHGKLAIIPIGSNESYTDFDPRSHSDPDLDLQIGIRLPQYPSMEILVLESFLTRRAVSRVLLNGKEMLCKARRTGLQDLNLTQSAIRFAKENKTVTARDILISKPGVVHGWALDGASILHSIA